MQAWENFLKQVEKEIGPETAKKWLHTLRVTDFDACNLYLEANDAFQVMWFNEHIRKKAEQQLFNNNHKKIKIHLSIKGQSAYQKKSRKEPHSPPPFTLQFDALDPLLTFENYIPSEANLLPHKLLFKATNYDPISSTVIPSTTELAAFNPIYLFGGQGSGKTHLLMATAQALKTSGHNALYTRCETFTEHVVSAIRAGEMGLFRQAYRSVDILLIDDVHLFSRKGATQEELFHTFNSLHLAGKQIILAANCSPSELQHIEPRLVSRFEWGIVLPLDPLPPEDVKKVVEKKAEAFKTVLHPKVEDFLIQTFSSTTNSVTKALEALLMRHHLRLQEQKKPPAPITVQVAKYLLKDLIDLEEQSALSPEKIIKVVAEYYGITTGDILSKNQKRECVLPRQIAMYYCRSKLNIPYTKLGDIFSRDHSTVMSSVKSVTQSLEANDKDLLSVHSGINKLLHR
jgi:chromosomal replication initiator protein